MTHHNLKPFAVIALTLIGFVLITLPISLRISGPLTGEIGLAQPFSAFVDPISVTLPITYVWQATDQALLLRVSNKRSDGVSFTWTTSGVKVITVTATNAGGTVTDTHMITVTPATSSGPPLLLAIGGMASGETDRPYIFHASIGPLTTTLPLTFTWNYDLGTMTASAVYTNVNDFIQYHTITWSLSGTYAITVTVSNVAGSITGTHLFPVYKRWRVYLPVVIK
jgi:hypothetical protein